MDHPFWREDFIVKTDDELRQIQTCSIKEVWIDIKKGVDVAGATKQEAEAGIDKVLEHIAPPKPVEVRVSMADEVKRAAKICAKAKEAVVSMFQEARMGNAVDHEAAGALVDEISSSVMRNPGALISLARLRSADDYTYMHSVAVCALMVALSRQLSLDEKQTRDAGMAGLLHDLGKALMPMEVLNKPGKLTEEEFRIIKGHPVEGHRLLVEGGGASEVALDVCLYHHEKVDGSGYPKGLKGDEISLFAKMGAICDVYDAITSNGRRDTSTSASSRPSSRVSAFIRPARWSSSLPADWAWWLNSRKNLCWRRRSKCSSRPSQRPIFHQKSSTCRSRAPRRSSAVKMRPLGG
jgi:HD-GYP domain-containing protein (c-di-GMP phosphodiesterase class II)